jgi:predicted nuclease of predicted toxin-antitoxin system
MPRFLIDVNLPYRFSVWSGDAFAHMRDIGETWTDTRIWQYAGERDLVIVTKDTDFSDRAMISTPPPRVVHLRFGNMRMREFHTLISRLWPSIVALSAANRLIRVYQDRIEAVE